MNGKYAGKFAAKRGDGHFAYVVTTSSWGKSDDRIEWATSLKEAKSQYGWTRMLHTFISVRRATVEDLSGRGSS